jgi:hypothetical protein
LKNYFNIFFNWNLIKYFIYWKFDILRISNNEIKKIKKNVKKGKEKKRTKINSKKKSKEKIKTRNPKLNILLMIKYIYKLFI